MIQEIKEIRRVKIDKNSILFKLWKYFVFFAGLILISIWLFQTVFLSSFYETMKIREVTKVGNELRSDYNSKDFETKLSNYANTKGLEIKVLDENGAWVYPLRLFDEFVERPRMIWENFDKFFGSLKRDNRTYKIYTVRYENLKDPSIIYAGYLGNTDGEEYYLYINSVLKPVDATVDVIRRILVIISFLALIFASITAYFVSKRLSGPLVRMSNTAKELAKGDYKVQFRKGEYTEIDDLSNTLNYAKDELTKTIEMRKDLVANVSHDLKTPLTVIKSYGEMIRDISGSNEALRNKHLETIINEADNLTALVNDLLDLSKIESNLEKIKKEEFRLEDSVYEVLDRFKINKNYSDYKFEIDSNGDTRILGDRSKINQVIYNLINNAINYSPVNKNIKLVIKGDENKTEFHCIDKGIGIREEDINGIWDRFYRVRNNHTRPEIGTGLGLYIVKTIMDLHGYEYGVHSKINEGSDFYFIGNK
ncbi:sensor histidine kinase [Peptoniphilus sp. SGI.035]|uniref:sensor histidine kinase n=1 Tax=Peptoniphilus sp. SGI.035 TaxID=3420564 RepID=UPI003D006F9C